jgi:hypothetical protein
MASEDPKDFWPEFGNSSLLEEVTCDDGSGLARKVLETYGLECSASIDGGVLANLDIKRMDAIQVIKLSLLEASAENGTLYEPIMQSDGSVDFVEIGKATGLSGSDYYYEIQSGTYIENCGGVMVTGGRPLAERRPVEFSLIWEGGFVDYYDTGILHNDCIEGNFSQHCTIIFNDPHLESNYKDGIDNLYEINESNPWDTIMGYARYIWWDGAGTDTEAQVVRQNTAKIVISLSEPNEDATTLGTLVKRPTYTKGGYRNPNCYDEQGDRVDPKTGVLVPIPPEFRYDNLRGTQVDKFKGILDVYIKGVEISDLRGVATDSAASLSTEPTADQVKVTARIDKTYPQLWKLSLGTHYQVAYDGVGQEGGADVYIVFADNSRRDDPIAIDGTKVNKFYIDPECKYANDEPDLEDEGLILPHSPTGGILVSKIYVSMLLETPSIEVYHPDGTNKRAEEIARGLKYLVAPLVSVEEPTPKAFNGELIDQTASIFDHDPTTAQDMSDTPLEQAYDAMAGNGMQLSLSFLDEDGCRRLSGALFDYLNSGDGTDSVFICGPDAEPELGGRGPNGGTVNAINYSYQDSNSYTISVNVGPKVLGNFAQVDGGPSPLQTEDLSATGTVIQDIGNHIHYKVRIDGFGERVAVNTAPAVLRVGDKVQVSVHNVPMEI